jgi:hypothetical protein
MANDIGMNISARELEALSRRLKEQTGGRAQRRYRAAIQDAAPAIVTDLRAAALAAGNRVTSTRAGRSRNAQGSRDRRRQGPLSARIASAIEVQPRPDGVRVVVDAAQVDARYGHSLPRYLDGELRQSRRWRHQVFGNEEVWTQQTGAPWFFRTFRSHADAVERGLAKAMDDVADDITR